MAPLLPPTASFSLSLCRARSGALAARGQLLRAALLRACVTAALAGSARVAAESPPSPALQERTASDLSREELEALELEDLLALRVSTATKHEQSTLEAPATISVITRDEIETRGLASVADALRSVPGLHDVFDLVSHNVGVRGVNGGIGASGSVLKVLVDGDPVSFLPTTGNFLGEELVPIEAVERIEIIRGPASAVYGANAFLGVVNVITRSGASARGVRVRASVGLQPRPSYGGGVLVQHGTDDFEAVVAVHASRIDRSGLRLPSTGPRATRYEARGPSAGDVASPVSVLARLSSGTVGEGLGRFGASATLQLLDTMAEFESAPPLTHLTRRSVTTQSYRAQWRRSFGNIELGASASGRDATPSPADRISLGDASTVFLRSVGAQGFGGAIEAVWRPTDAWHVSALVDVSREHHRLQSYSTLLVEDLRSESGTVLRPAGTITSGAGHGLTRRFDLLGASAQALWNPLESFNVTLGARLEEHSVYGARLSPRVGIVWAPRRSSYSIKALFGSSFKAPSAAQLHTRPLQPGDVIGNPALKPQSAWTAELAFVYRLTDRGEFAATAFFTHISDRVEFLQRGLFLAATNASIEQYLGGELEARLRVTPEVTLRLGAGASALASRRRTLTTFVVGPEPEQPLFPPVAVHAVATWRLPWAGLQLAPEASFVGPRAASQANALEAGRAYVLPAFAYTALTISMPERPSLWGLPLRFALRASDLFSTATPEPGFNGIDVPALGRTIQLTVVQALD